MAVLSGHAGGIETDYLLKDESSKGSLTFNEMKQVFRELYTLTKPEKDEGTRSRRYAGHQVQPRKAMALLGTRGWVHHPSEGVRKTFHDEGVTAWLEAVTIVESVWIRFSAMKLALPDLTAMGYTCVLLPARE